MSTRVTSCLNIIRLKRCKIVGRFIFVGITFLIFVTVLFGGNIIELGFKSPREVDGVILENIIQRLDNLERKVSEIHIQNDKKELSAGRGHKGHVAKNKRTCPIPKDWRHPFCAHKVKWMKALWQHFSDCYIDEHSIDPTDDCSVLRFFSEVESWCPLLPGREKPDPVLFRLRAIIRTDLEGLLKLLQVKDWVWMRDRATRMWSYWTEGAIALRKRKPEIEKRASLNILLIMGSFSLEPNFFYKAYRGGPLGELVQWTDLICTLYILGHNVTVTANLNDLKKLLNVPKKKGCASAPRDDEFDQIYTDYIGHKSIGLNVGPNHSQYRCKTRILDSFGTEAEFNFAEYAEPIIGGRSPWANADLHLRQIFTMFPHSPDNSFLGFVVDSPAKTAASKKLGSKKPLGLVYGKETRFWKGQKKYLDTLNKFLDLHATTSGPIGEMKSNVPDYVTNHGILKGDELKKLLARAKVFIGLGFPYEGPAPLEAIAHGSIFLNAKLDPPHSRLNNWFFALKPTFRALSSQHPYAEEFIGEPHVFTVNIENMTSVEDALKRILKTEVKPYLPLEWTPEGMLERVSSYAEYMDFCYQNRQIWPPKQQLHLILGDEGISCKKACWNKGLLCESLFFPIINTQNSFKELGIKCDRADHQDKLVMPAYSSADYSCLLQNHPLLFSCVASAPKYARLCPCRDFQKQQVALCKKCT